MLVEITLGIRFFAEKQGLRSNDLTIRTIFFFEVIKTAQAPQGSFFFLPSSQNCLAGISVRRFVWVFRSGQVEIRSAKPDLGCQVCSPSRLYADPIYIPLFDLSCRLRSCLFCCIFQKKTGWAGSQARGYE